MNWHLALFAVIVVAMVSIFVIGSLHLWTFMCVSKPKSDLERWAVRNGMTLLQAKWSWRRLRFGLRSGGSQSVLRFTVRDAVGKTRSGYALIGGFFIGPFSREVTVQWDKPTDS